jgi:hypothetical protein
MVDSSNSKRRNETQSNDDWFAALFWCIKAIGCICGWRLSFSPRASLRFAEPVLQRFLMWWRRLCCARSARRKTPRLPHRSAKWLRNWAGCRRCLVYAGLWLRLDDDPYLRRVKATADLSRIAGCVIAASPLNTLPRLGKASELAFRSAWSCV